MSSSLVGSLPAGAVPRTKRLPAGPTVSPGRAGFHWLAGATVGSSATLRGPVRRSYSGASDTRQLAAAWARSAAVYVTCASFSASAMVVGEIAGPTTGPVPNAGGCPGGGADGAGFGGSAARAGATRPATAAPSTPTTGPFKNCLRELDMPVTVPEVGRAR